MGAKYQREIQRAFDAKSAIPFSEVPEDRWDHFWVAFELCVYVEFTEDFYCFHVKKH